MNSKLLGNASLITPIGKYTKKFKKMKSTLTYTKFFTSRTSQMCKHLSIALTLMMFVSCDEQEFLNEVPLDFYSPENSYVTHEQFESALHNLYARIREDFWGIDGSQRPPRQMWSGTDLVFSDKDLGFNPNYSSLLLPANTNFVYSSMWQPLYRLIYDANVIIGRADDKISQLTEDEKVLVKAEAMFFRAYAYKMLANLYGGVPIVLEEINEPKRDFVRATRKEVYEQSASDLEFAAANLPDIDEVDDSRISRVAANHVLSEVFISLERWQDAVNAATKVIDHPGMALMTERFGSRVDDPAFGGDVYWDLFRQENQNRSSSGNTESIWVMQYEYLVNGGGEGGYLLERFIIPRLWQAKIANNDGSLTPLIPDPNTFYYGRGSGFLRPTNYFYETIWEKSGYDQDIRNSEYNIVRDFKVNNPDSDHDGKWVFADNVPIKLETVEDTARNFYPVIAKASTPGRHPQELYAADQTVPGTLTSNAERTYRDNYLIRLAETYLLRAEAYLGMGNNVKAAADINVVRSRAKAPDVDPAEVDIDYILDERMRELYFEEFRVLTLTRLGKLVERTKKYNSPVGNTMQEYHNLWPIPFSEIEKNTEATLEQNPGY